MRILQGEALAMLKTLPDESVHCIVSSPPYWRQRQYLPEGAVVLRRTDRSTVAHEYVFHLTKNNDYWYDADAARTPVAPSRETRLAQNVDAQEGSARANAGGKTNGGMKAVKRLTGSSHGRHADTPLPPDERRAPAKVAAGNPRTTAAAAPGIDDRKHQQYDGANLRSVWWISTAQYREGHYAVMPDRLAELCIVAGCPAGGTVLDPFGGAGTTGLVADRLHRDAILIELNPEYAAMAERRIRGESSLLAEVSA